MTRNELLLLMDAAYRCEQGDRDASDLYAKQYGRVNYRLATNVRTFHAVYDCLNLILQNTGEVEVSDLRVRTTVERLGGASLFQRLITRASLIHAEVWDEAYRIDGAASGLVRRFGGQ